MNRNGQLLNIQGSDSDHLIVGNGVACIEPWALAQVINVVAEKGHHPSGSLIVEAVPFKCLICFPLDGV